MRVEGAGLEGMRIGMGGGGDAIKRPRPHATWGWRGQTNILGLEMDRKENPSHNLSLYSDSDNKPCRRMRQTKLSAVGEGVD